MLLHRNLSKIMGTRFNTFLIIALIFLLKSQVGLGQSPLVYGNTELSGMSTGTMNILSRTAPNQCSQTFGAVELRISFDLGDTYNWGSNLFNKQVILQVTAVYGSPGVNQTWPVTMNINQLLPEKVFIKKITTTPQYLNAIQVSVTGYSGSSSVNNFVRLTASYAEDNQVSASSATVTPVALTPVAGKWEQMLTWTSSCTNISNYQLQLMRIYNAASPDWSQALSIETASASLSQKLTLAEGTGSYQWRIRALGNKPGGIANPDNWGPWSASSAFTFTQPEEDKNWIYSRTFTEGNKVSERVTYANGLQQVNQQQTRLQGDNQIVIVQTLQDFVGRNALTSLPVPVPAKSEIGYQPNLLQDQTTSTLLTQVKFDTDPKVTTPLAKVQGDYYSGADVNVSGTIINPGVANAEGYPYTRTLFTNDGTSRVKEQSGVGLKHALATSTGGKTVRTYYANVSEGELVRVFGKEAPEVANVQKVITTDGNDVSSVSYQNKDGKVLATSLIAGAAGALDILPSQGAAPVVAEKVMGGTKISPTVISASKPMLFTVATNVTVDYDITPALVRSLYIDPTGTMMGYYQLDGNGNDVSGRGNTATILNGATQTTGVFNTYAYNLDGSDDYLKIEDSPDMDFGSQDFTVAMWVKKNAGTSGWDNSSGIGKWNTGASPGTNEWSLSLTTDGNNNIPSFGIEVGTTTYSVSGTTNMTVGTWYQLTAMRKGNQLLIYVNGAQQGAYTLPSSTVEVNNVGLPVYVGRIGPASYYTAGVFDEMQIYRRALSANEVTDLYSCGVSICKTCDYKVEFFLHNQEDPNYSYPGGLPSQTIQPGNCSQQASLKWDPVAFTMTGLQAGIPYVLEKRISIYNTNTSTQKEYLEEHITALRATKAAGIDASLAAINTYLNTNNLIGLYTYLQAQSYAYDSERNTYAVPLGCGETIFIPKEELCEDLTVVSVGSPPTTCTAGGKTFEDYFETLNNITVASGATIPYISFTNKYTNTVQNFIKGQLNTMMLNLMADNLQLSCQDVWDVWIEESKNYAGLSTMTGSGYSYNLLDEFLKELEAKLDGRRPSGSGDDLCAVDGNGRYYFIRKTEVYGKLGGVTAAPDVTRAYRQVYVNEDIVSHVNTLKGLNNPQLIQTDVVSMGTFTGSGYTDCSRYKLYKITKDGDFLSDPTPKIADNINKTKSACETACESRREEFKQAIIANIKTQNSAATFEHYSVYMNTFNNKWTAVLDSTYNHGVAVTYSQCEIETMASALVENCQKNYCVLTNQYNANGDLVSIGSTTEIANLTKVFSNEFEVNVGANGQSCPGWDYMSSSVVQQGDNPSFDVLKNWQWGAILDPPANPANFLPSRILTVTTTGTSLTPGTLRWAADQVNYNMPGSDPILINFNIPGNGPHTIITTGLVFSKTVVLDATTQPSNIYNRPRIVLKRFTNSSTTLGLIGAHNSVIKGLEFSSNSAISIVNSDNVKIISNIIKSETEGSVNGLANILFSESNNSVIQGNVIGTDLNFQQIFGYQGGISLTGVNNSLIGGPTYNHGNIVAFILGPSINFQAISDHNIVENNVLRNNFVPVYPSGYITFSQVTPGFESRFNKISKNLIDKSSNFNEIYLVGNNQNKARPVISNVSGNIVSGTSVSLDTIELFLMNAPPGAGGTYGNGDIVEYLGSTVTNGSGNWTFTNIVIPNGYYLAASATDPLGNTSEMGYWASVVNPCNVTHSLCFRFKPETQQPIVVPVNATSYSPQIIPCAEIKGDLIRSSIEDQKNVLLAAAEQSFRDSYFNTCPDPSTLIDNLTISYPVGMHHYTLYYYDRAGNLMRTVSPKGVATPLAVTNPAQIATARTQFPAHTLDTRYEYNSLGQLVKQTSPDAGTTLFWYNDIGQLRFSQSAQQAIDLKYSYTKYDNLGRVTEVGEAGSFVAATLVANRNDLTYPQTGGQQVTSTTYTTTFPTSEFVLPNSLTQRYLRNRVSYSITDEDGLSATTTDRTQTVYSYDPHGNVEWLVQKIATLDRLIQISYEYDLISGNVLKVSYNPNSNPATPNPDQYFHKYEYDADNRIKAVYTSKDGYVWEKDATYDYHLHGPLKRATIGEDQVQGLDYTYTVHGWLKGINNPVDLQNLAGYNTANDPGTDGGAGKLSAKDAFGMTLGYYAGDFKHTGYQLNSGYTGELVPTTGRDLYNGNIGSQTSNMRFPSAATTVNKQLTGHTYTYDQLNRIKSSTYQTWGTSSYTTVTNNYSNVYTYDANGNLATAVAYGNGTNVNLDNLTYSYTASTNKLSQITDSWAVTPYSQDVETQAANNYVYDANGNLTRDVQQQTTITWNPYGKVKQVLKDNGNTTQFKYDASGNRVLKRRANPAGLVSTDYYVHDAGGNVMAVYNKVQQGANPEDVSLTEIPIYGSERLGQYRKSIAVIGPGVSGTSLQAGETRITTNTNKNAYENTSYLVNPAVQLTLQAGFTYTAPQIGQGFSVRVSANAAAGSEPDVYARELGQKNYELKDHLGNVRTVVTDTKQSTITANVPGSYEAEVVSLSNYYPFGMEQPGRTWTLGKYRYGFNGKEKDQDGEWGTTNYDYGFRIYNPAIGKFLSVDPLTKVYPMLTPYQFASNRPIDGIDLDGLEYYSPANPPFQQIEFLSDLLKPKAKKSTVKELIERAENNQKWWSIGTAGGVALSLDVYTGGKISKELVNQLKTQVIANLVSEGVKASTQDKAFTAKEAKSMLERTLTNSLSGLDGADAVIGVFVKNKKAANVLASLVDYSYDAKTGNLEFTSIVKGKEVSDVIIDVAFNFATDGTKDKIKNTKFSKPVKEALEAANVDLDKWLKDIANPEQKKESKSQDKN